MTTQNTAAELRDEYLTQLDEAIGGLPHGLAVELRAGIAEELSGLDYAALTQRIASLGSPSDVARAAALEAPDALTPLQPTITVQAPPPAAQEPVPFGEGRGYAVTAAIVLGVGGIVLPVIGWIVGAVLVTNSKLWTAKEKLWAILMPFITVAVVAAVTLITRLAPIGTQSDGVGASINPLLPSSYDLMWSSTFFIGFIIAPLSGLWLLLRLRGRSRDNFPGA